MCLHDHTFPFLFLFFVRIGLAVLAESTATLFDFGSGSRRCNVHRYSSTACCSSDRRKSMFGTLVTSFRCFHIPHVSLERVTPAPDSHLGEVSNGIFGFGKT